MVTAVCTLEICKLCSGTVTEHAETVTEHAETVTECAETVTERAGTVTECAETVTERAGASTERAGASTERADIVKDRAERVTEQSERVTEHFDASTIQCKIAVKWCGNVVEPTLYLTSRVVPLSCSPTKISLENAPTNNSHPMLDGCCLLILKQSVGVTEKVAPTFTTAKG